MSSSRTVRRLVAAASAAVLAITMAACGGSSSPDESSAASGDATGSADSSSSSGGSGNVSIDFWHVYNAADGEAMDKLIAEFETENPGITVNGQFIGGFGDLGKKVVSALQAGNPPDLAIAYQTDVTNYMTSGKVLSLDSYVEDATDGLTSEDLDDIIPEELTINRYASADGDYMSFPFTANLLVMYYNKDILSQSGIDAPAKTWAEFTEQCAAIKAATNLPCYSASSNSSTMDGIAYSFGADTVDADGKPTFDQPAWTDALTMLSDLAGAGEVELAATQASVSSPDVSTFVGGGAAYILTSSRNVPFVQETIGDAFDWGTTMLPQKSADADPVTTLYGPGIAAFDTGDQARARAAWLFTRFLVSPEAQSQWAAQTGNLPIRTSVVDDSTYQSRLTDYPATKLAVDSLKYGRFEGATGDKGVIAPVLSQTRTAIEDAMTAVLSSGADVAAVQQKLQDAAVAASAG